MSQFYKIARGPAGFYAGASILALALAIGAPLAARAEVGAEVRADQPLPSYADIVAADKPAVVTVTTEIAAAPRQMQNGADGGLPPDEFFRRFFGENGQVPGMPQVPGQGGGPDMPQEKAMALGSGFIVSADGTVVTNNHVVDHATKITVTLDDGTELPATLVGTDAKNDIAVLKVDAKGSLPTVDWGDSDALRAGDAVLAIGDPFGIGTTVTAGIVSARGRDLHNGPYDDFIQIDAAINHGNSGGPLVDATGKVVGINTAIYSPNGGNVGVGFAIPSAQARAVVEKIVANGTIEHGFIGVQIQPVDQDVAGALGLTAAKGALVASVQDGSPAAAAGIRAGDVVLTVNGAAVADPRGLSRAIADLAPGDKASLKVWRGGQETALDLTVGRLGAEEATNDVAPDPQAPEVGVAALGLRVQTLTDGDAQSLGLAAGTAGVVITDVDPAGKAAAEGLVPGDVIESVNQAPVASAEELSEALKAAQKADRTAALLMIDRHGQKSFVAVPLA